MLRANKKKDALASFFFLSVGTGGPERPRGGGSGLWARPPPVTEKRERDKGENRERREQRICEERRECLWAGNEKSHPCNHIAKAKKHIMASSPPKSHNFGGISCVFSLFCNHEICGYRVRKKYIISKNGFGRDVEQLSPAVKAQHPFLRAEGCTLAWRSFCAFCLFNKNRSFKNIKRHFISSTTNW